MSNQLNLPQVDSKNLKDDQWKQDAPELNFEGYGKAVNTYVHVIFLFFIFNWFVKIKLFFEFLGKIKKCCEYFQDALCTHTFLDPFCRFLKTPQEIRRHRGDRLDSTESPEHTPSLNGASPVHTPEHISSRHYIMHGLEVSPEPLSPQSDPEA